MEGPHSALRTGLSSITDDDSTSQGPRRSRRLATSGGPITRSTAANRSSILSLPSTASLNDVEVGLPLQRVSSGQLSTSSTSVDRGSPAGNIPTNARGLRGRLQRAAIMTTSSPTINTMGLSTASTSRGPRPLATSRSPTGRGTRMPRTRRSSESRLGDPTLTDAVVADQNGPCQICEDIQGRITAYLDEVRGLQETAAEGYDAYFERMRVTTQLMRQTNETMREWRTHTNESVNHSLAERSQRLNDMSAMYRQISDIIQGAVRGLTPGSSTSTSTSGRSRTRSSRRGQTAASQRRVATSDAPTTSAAATGPSNARRRRYGEYLPPRALMGMPRLIIGHLPFAGLAAGGVAGASAGLDYEALLRLGDLMGDVVPRGLSQSQINRLPSILHDEETAKTMTSSEGREDHKQCYVCLTEYSNAERLRILPCFHRFHSECIDEWIKSNPTCPLCRVQVEIDD